MGTVLVVAEIQKGAIREASYGLVAAAQGIDGAEVNEGFLKASRNIEGLDILPTMGANVYDILKRDTLVITKAGIEALEARLK